MKVTAFTILCLALAIQYATAKTITLNADGTNVFALTYLSPEYWEDERVRIEMTLDTMLAYNTEASVICMNFPDNTYTVPTGTALRSFGIRFTCPIGAGCSQSDHMNTELWGQGLVTFDSPSTYTWLKAGSEYTPLDLASSNIGSVSIVSGKQIIYD